MQPLAAVNIREQPNDRNITEIGLHCVQWNSAIICKMQLQLSAKMVSAKMVCNFLQKGLAKNIHAIMMVKVLMKTSEVANKIHTQKQQ